ncbi:MAG: DnaD domain protein [Candidatus Weimeria sp.]
MASINLHAETQASFTCVSNNFIDNYMKGLDGDDVKVYLRLLRCVYDSESDFSIASTADCLGLSARNVRTSLDSLSAAGILSLDYDDNGELCDICMRPLSAQMTEEGDGQMTFSFTDDVPSSDQKKKTPDQKKKASASKEIPAPSDRAEAEEAVSEVDVTPDDSPADDSDASLSSKDRSSIALEDDEELSQILFIAQRYLGISLNSKAVDTILYWHFDLHMNEDMIDYMITTTLADGKCKNRANLLRYLNTIAVNWYKNGIHSVNDARNEKKQHSENVIAVKKAFAISANLNDVQLNYVDKWFNEWHFSKEMVTTACNKTMTNIAQPKFNYADSILEAWHEKGITDLSQVEEDDENHSKATKSRFAASGKNSQSPKKNGFNSYSEKNNYDNTTMESILLKNNTI